MDIYWIWFKILNLEYKKKLKLLQEYKQIEKIYFLNTNILKDKFKFKQGELSNFIDKSVRERASEIYKYNEKNNIGIISILDDVYPYLLKQIYNPPILIYYKGNLELLSKKNVHIFLGKNLDNYGDNILKEVCINLSNNNVSVISRDEKIDKKIYEYNLNNIVVLAEGIKDMKINTKGIILSEYEYDVIRTKTNLLQRNRILTGLSNETLIIQAKILDGANYIVDLALEQGRNISVFPGDIYNENNKYTNLIIKEGANVINNINELLVYEH